LLDGPEANDPVFGGGGHDDEGPDTKKVAAAWLRRIAAYSSEFLEWVGTRKFRNPETGRDVKFTSLPTEEQSRIHAQWRGARGAQVQDPGLEDTGEETWSGGKVYRADVEKDTFVHFTPRSRAEQILESGKLLAEPPYDKFGLAGVQAISLGYGGSVPEVQTTHIKGVKEDDPLVAVVFQTSSQPKTGYVEEVIWDDDVGLKDARVVGADEARHMLDQAPGKITGDDMVVYGERKASRSAARSVQVASVWLRAASRPTT